MQEERAKDYQKQNRSLSILSFVTGFGDYLSFFAILQLTQDLFSDAYITGYNVAIKGLSVAISGILLPAILSRLSLRWSLFGTQIASAIVVTIFFWAYQNGALSSPWQLYSVVFFVTFFRQLFDAAREAISKDLAQKVHQQRPMQAQILRGLYSAQVLGPITAFFCITQSGIALPLLIDIGSFLLAAFLASGIHVTKSFERKSSILGPFKYLRQKPLLLRLFLLRSVGFWSAISLFNLLLFPVITKKYGLTMIYSVWLYVAIAFGALLAVSYFRKAVINARRASQKLHEGSMALWGHLTIAFTILLFSVVEDFALGFLVIVVHGVGVGLNALSTQTLRRQLTTKEEFPEIVGLEIVVARATDWIVATIAVFTLRNFNIPFESLLALSFGVFFALGFLHLQFDRNLKADSFEVKASEI